MSNLRWKVALVLFVLLGTSLFLWLKGLTLGLDLKGGVQFVLRVNVNEALSRDAQVTRDQIVEQAKEAVDRRINELGVLEPLIAVQGANRDELLVQLPGFTDEARARTLLGTTARLDWKLVDAGPARDSASLLVNGVEPPGTEIVQAVRAESYYRLRSDVAVGGRDIRSARTVQDRNGETVVGFTLTPDGGRRFAALTADNIGRQLAIVLDGRVQSAPVIEHAITGGEGSIRGGFSLSSANDLALVLRSGALPVSMTYLGGEYVGPTLGLQSIHSGIGASLMGLGFVATFMLLYYNRAGMNAVLSIVVNLVVLLGAMAALGSAMTLPGIAGFILTIGMGVDSNVLIFERIKEELQAGRTASSAVRVGFDRVFLTILDTHVASLVAAAFLFQFGTGSIRGFATTLTLGLLTNVFTAVFVSRTIFDVTLSFSKRPQLRLWTFTRVARQRAIDFMSYRRYAFALSTLVVAGGIAFVTVRGLPMGLDFTGGTTVLARFASSVSEDDVRRAIPGDETVQRYGAASDHTLLIRLPQSNVRAEGQHDEVDLQAGVRTIRTAVAQAGLPAFEVAGTNTVGPAIGTDMQKKGVMATIASLAGITAYIALRFRPGFAAGAIVATAHDLVVTVTMLSVCGYDLNLNTVAAVLTIAGYSVNDTIVIFDRVREKSRSLGHVSIAEAVNIAVNDTLGRTIITASTTFLSVLALFIFGGDVLQGFAFAMLVGILTGMYSTVFVAAPIAALLARARR